MLPASRTRKIVKAYINFYNELCVLNLNLEQLESMAEGRGEELINFNSFWWERFEKPVLRGSPINQLYQAICAVNGILSYESEGMEPFES